MESATPPLARRCAPKRVVFDRRYGWIVDDWRDPSEEALAAGRGMFCILPIAKTLVKAASQSIDYASQCVVKVLEDPDKCSPQSLKANLNIQIQNLQNSLKRPGFKFLLARAHTTMVPSHSPDQADLKN